MRVYAAMYLGSSYRAPSDETDLEEFSSSAQALEHYRDRVWEHSDPSCPCTGPTEETGCQLYSAAKVERLLRRTPYTYREANRANAALVELEELDSASIGYWELGPRGGLRRVE